MMIHWKINPDLTDTGERGRFDTTPERPPVLTKPFWVPFNRVVVGTGPVIDDDTTVITESGVTQTVSFRDKTTGEIDADDTALIDQSIAANGSVIRAILEWAFEMENRVRTLESQPPITVQQFKTAVKNRLRD